MNKIIHTNQNTVLLDCELGQFWAYKDDLITEQLIEYGAHTRNELAMCLNYIQPGNLVVDIGAHIGTFTIPICRKIGQDGRILAVEGDKNTYNILKQNVGLNGLIHNIQICNEILGDKENEFLERTDVAKNSGAGYYQPSDSGESCFDALKCLTTNGFSRADFIKIDVEGMECRILRSLEPIIVKNKPILYIEVVEQQLNRFGDSSNQLNELLTQFGYKFFRNIGERNSKFDNYELKELNHISEGGKFFDVLAIPKY